MRQSIKHRIQGVRPSERDLITRMHNITNGKREKFVDNRKGFGIGETRASWAGEGARPSEK